MADKIETETMAALQTVAATSTVEEMNASAAQTGTSAQGAANAPAQALASAQTVASALNIWRLDRRDKRADAATRYCSWTESVLRCPSLSAPASGSLHLKFEPDETTAVEIGVLPRKSGRAPSSLMG